MKRGKRSVLFAVCAVVVAAFALTGCGGGETKGEQVTKEQYEQILTKMLEAFPSVLQKSNAPMVAEETELTNFTIHELLRMLALEPNEREIESFKNTMKVDNKKIEDCRQVYDMNDNSEYVTSYFAESDGSCWDYYLYDGVWHKRKIEPEEGVVQTDFESIRFIFTELKSRFDLFEYRGGKYLCKADKAPNLLARLSLKVTDETLIEETEKMLQDCSFALTFADGKLVAMSFEFSSEDKFIVDHYRVKKIKNITQITFTDYGTTTVTLPNVG